MNNPWGSNIISGVTAAKFTVAGIIAATGGFIAKFLGGFDSLIITLVTLIVIDYVSGVIGAIYEKKLSSTIGYRGIIKKVFMLLVVGVAVALQRIMPDAVPLREITILFFIANEGLSVLENSAKIIPLPQKLKDVLLQLQEKLDDLSENSNNSNTEDKTE